jgi:hypothetical protein
MALITEYLRRNSKPSYRTTVECGWNFAQVDRRTLLRLETYGSARREIPGKRSPSLELDEQAARKLVEILRTAFPSL